MWFSIFFIIGINYLLYVMVFKQIIDERRQKPSACPKCSQRDFPIDVVSKKHNRSYTESIAINTPFKTECSACEGSGGILTQHKERNSHYTPCMNCGGKGYVEEGETISTKEFRTRIYNFTYQCSKCLDKWSKESAEALYKDRSILNKFPKLEKLLTLISKMAVFVPCIAAIYVIFNDSLLQVDGFEGTLFRMIAFVFTTIGYVIFLCAGALLLHILKILLTPFTFVASVARKIKNRS